MLTYDLAASNAPLYITLYNFIRDDIKTGKVAAGEKLPSKRALAKNLGVSSITVENAYDQLMGEGYIYSLPKKGYFVSSAVRKWETEALSHGNLRDTDKNKIPFGVITKTEKEKNIVFDFSTNRSDADTFPFSIWAKLLRETISIKGSQLLEVPPCGGVLELRQAIAGHLESFRGMKIDPEQVIVGAGTEYLYGLLIQLLGNDKKYAVENLGYKKIQQVYTSFGVNWGTAHMDDDGINVHSVERNGADIVHTSPTHHFPTGITMPLERRYELLNWAREKDGRYIIEDDYDSEFRLKGKPIPPLMSIDNYEKVIYMNTFSKSLASTVRISYMVLPEHLACAFYDRLSFYACTVSTFEQYTLAEFISRGYFEKHINRMRLLYVRKRKQVMEMVEHCLDGGSYRIVENDSGLHFLIELKTNLEDAEVEQRMMKHGIKITAIRDFGYAFESERHGKSNGWDASDGYGKSNDWEASDGYGKSNDWEASDGHGKSSDWDASDGHGKSDMCGRTKKYSDTYNAEESGDFTEYIAAGNKFIVNYSSMDLAGLEKSLEVLSEVIRS